MEATSIPTLSSLPLITRPTFLINVSNSHTLNFPHSFFLHQSNNSYSRKQLAQLGAKQLRNLKPLQAASSETPLPESTERWLLEPIGDGDTRHIGFRVPLPEAFEIVSNEVTVGRVPEKANIVIPVATVSGLHARLQKKDGALLVTDLDSTNGTFVGDQRLGPGDPTPVPPGSALTFGDVHLAIFRVSKLQNMDPPAKPEESEAKIETDGQNDSVEANS